ncbi:MAG: FecR domain-containing protein [Bryobacteraceae bacterium]
MNRQDEITGDRLDQTLNEMHEDAPSPEQVGAAIARVGARLFAPGAHLCAEFQLSIPGYAAGQLVTTRRLLLEDHLSRCPACRRALADYRVKPESAPAPIVMPSARRAAWPRWAIAAGVLLAALVLGRDPLDRALAPAGPRAVVDSISGSLYRVSGGELSAGASLSDGEVIRTGPDARAILRLADGSLVELNERTELNLQAAWSGQTIRLDRGDVIVRAAPQRRGSLRVVTRDSVASVKGTIFAVSSASAGSLVSVVEGAVFVSQLGQQRLLQAGEQGASSSALAAVPIRSAVAWSQDAENYYALLGDLIRIEKELAGMPGHAPRTETKLLRYLPANPVLYGAIPNVTDAVRQATALIEQRAAGSAILREWWTNPSGEKLRTLLDHIRSATSLLGEEIVFVVCRDIAAPKTETPALLAEVLPGRQEELSQALARIDSEIAFHIEAGLLLISSSPGSLAALRANLGRGASTPFADEIAARYANGAVYLIGLDIAALPASAPDSNVAAALGLTQMKRLFFEQRSGPGGDDMEAVLNFNGMRTGVASWLAPPAASGSAEYASSEAVVVVSASTRNPRQAFDELIALGGQGDSGLLNVIRHIESDIGVDLSNDLAAAIGTDFTIALERPSLPAPGWFIAVELLQPALFDSTARRFVENINRAHPGDNGPGLELTQESAVGRVWTTLKSRHSPFALHWTHDRGYLILGPDRGVATRAIATRDGGFPLIRSTRFRERIPVSKTLHNSGFLWLNANNALADFAAASQSTAVRSLLGEREPMLVLLNGRTEQIHAASRSRVTGILLDLFLVAGNGGTRKM